MWKPCLNVKNLRHKILTQNLFCAELVELLKWIWSNKKTKIACLVPSRKIDKGICEYISKEEISMKRNTWKRLNLTNDKRNANLKIIIFLAYQDSLTCGAVDILRTLLVDMWINSISGSSYDHIHKNINICMLLDLEITFLEMYLKDIITNIWTYHLFYFFFGITFFIILEWRREK